jgi:hypothetical protein
VTFAAPPVSQPPIIPDPARNAPHCRGSFLAVINEGDPVPLAQKEYILKLLEVYAKTSEKLVEENLEAFAVPDPVMKLSGKCLLLRDEDPGDLKSFKIRAFGTKAEVVQSKLFGNPLEHFMLEYQSRIYRVLDPEAPVEKKFEINI